MYGVGLPLSPHSTQLELELITYPWTLTKKIESESYILSKTMPRPYSAEAAVKFYNRGVEGLGYIHLQTWSWRSTSKSERKSKKKG